MRSQSPQPTNTNIYGQLVIIQIFERIVAIEMRTERARIELILTLILVFTILIVWPSEVLAVYRSRRHQIFAEQIQLLN